MISTFKTHKIIERRMKFLPAKIKKDENSDDFVIKILDNKTVKVRTYREMETEPFSIVTESRIIQNGPYTQKYNTSCYFHQVPTPVWYTESLLIDLEENDQKISQKVYYDNKFQPNHWSETYTTDVDRKKDLHFSEATIELQQDSEDVHYISLQSQETMAETPGKTVVKS